MGSSDTIVNGQAGRPVLIDKPRKRLNSNMLLDQDRSFTNNRLSTIFLDKFIVETTDIVKSESFGYMRLIDKETNVKQRYDY